MSRSQSDRFEAEFEQDFRTGLLAAGPAGASLPATVPVALPAQTRSTSLPGQSASLLTITIGALVGTNYMLAKFAVSNGATPVTAYYWQLLVASFVLLVTAVASGRKLVLTGRYLRYYLIGGLVGGSLPNLLAFWVLKSVPAGVFTVLITLSPLFTFVIASIVERKLLPMRRLAGVLIGFAGVTLATISGFKLNGVGAAWILIAAMTPILLAANNVYRNKAYPGGADPLSLALGTLLTQVLLLLPLMAFRSHACSPLDFASIVDFVVLAKGLITAVSLVLTLRLQKLTDGLGTSQIGYFITLTGVLAGAIFFNETVGAGLLAAIGLSFIGVAVTNGHIGPDTLARVYARRRLSFSRINIASIEEQKS